MKQDKKPKTEETQTEGVDFVFVPDLTEDSIPWRQVHFGYDFSGGRTCTVTDPVIIRKLDGNRFFGRVGKDGKLLADQHVNSDAAPTPSRVAPKEFPRKRRAKMDERDPDVLDPILFDDNRQ